MEEAREILFTAIEHGRTSIIQAIVNKIQTTTPAVDVVDLLKETNKESFTALHVATERGHSDIVRTLLAAGADPCAVDGEGRTPFQLAKDNNVKDVYVSEIFQAVGKNNVPMIQSLLNAGVPINVKDSSEVGNTLLHWASSYSTAEVVRMLCDHGLPVDSTNTRGETPLHDAVVAKSWNVVQELLRLGANREISAISGPMEGKTPKDLLEGNNWDGTSPDDEPDNKDGDSSSQHNQLTSNTEHTVENHTPTPSTPSATTVCSLDNRLHLLCPRPQNMVQHDGDKFGVNCEFLTFLISPNGKHKPALMDMLDTLYPLLEASNYAFIIQSAQKDHFVHNSYIPGSVVLLVNETLFSHQQAYRIVVNKNQATVIGASPVGVWYGMQTLMQLLKLFPPKEGIPALTIHDWPSMNCRAAMLDLSQGKHLSLEVIKYIVDVLAYLKYNQLQLRFENNYAYYGHENVWKNKQPYTSSDLTALECYCSRQFISLVPYQDSLGHFEEWLQHSEYSELGEYAPEQGENDQTKPPTSSSCLCPLVSNRKKLLADIHFQLLANFSSDFMNVGLDLTTEFGSWRSSQNDPAGCFAVHLKVLQQMAVHHGKTLQCWSSAFHQYPSLLCDTVLNCVLLEPLFLGDKDFEKRCKTLSEFGIPFYVCPSSMCYNSISGDINSFLPLLERSIQSAVSLGAIGIMICDWVGACPLRSVASGLLPFTATAAMSWNSSITKEEIAEHLPGITGAHLFHDDGIGKVLMSLSTLSSTMSVRDHMITNRLPSSVRVPVVPQRHQFVDYDVFYAILMAPDVVSVSSLDVVALKKCFSDIRSAQTKMARSSPTPGWLKDEIMLSADLMLLSCKIIRAVLVAYSKSSSEGTVDIFKLSLTARTDIANSLLAQVDQFGKLWDAMGGGGSKDRVMSQLRELTTTLIGKEVVI